MPLLATAQRIEWRHEPGCIEVRLSVRNGGSDLKGDGCTMSYKGTT